MTSPNQGLTPSAQLSGKLVSDDLDSSLANLVGNLGIGNGTAKNDIHWSQPGEKKLTGGMNWQPKTAPTTTWNPATMAPSVMAFPATTPTGMMGYAMPPQMGSMAMMTQPTMMYTQPVMRPANPFGPVSGAQVLYDHLTTTNWCLPQLNLEALRCGHIYCHLGNFCRLLPHILIAIKGPVYTSAFWF